MLRGVFFRALGLGKDKAKIAPPAPLSESGESIKSLNPENNLNGIKKPPSGFLTFLGEFRATSKVEPMKALVKEGSEVKPSRLNKEAIKLLFEFHYIPEMASTSRRSEAKL